MTTLQRIQSLHAAWNAATGQDLKLRLCDYEREFGYNNLLQAGFNEQDIHTVVKYLQRKIKEGSRLMGSLRWANCIGDLCRFEEDLQFARAELKAMQPKATPRQRAVEQLRPTIVPMTPAQAQDTSKPVAHFLKQLREAAS